MAGEPLLECDDSGLGHDIQIVTTSGGVVVHTGCCGCSTPVTAEHMDTLAAAWQRYRRSAEGRLT